MEYISAGLERLTLFTFPIFVAILGALFFKTPIDKKIIITLVLTYLGLWIIFNQEAMLNTFDATLGVTLVGLAAFSFSFYILFSTRIINQIGSLWFTSLAISVSSAFVLLYYGISLDWANLEISNKAWLWVIALAIFSTVLPSFMVSEALAIIGSTKASIVGTLGPIITIIIATFTLHEPFTVEHAMGTILVIAGVMLLTIKKTNHANSLNANNG